MQPEMTIMATFERYGRRNSPRGLKKTCQIIEKHCKKKSSSDQNHALQRTDTENSKQIFPKKELRGHSPNFHIHVSVCDFDIPTIDLPVLLKEICGSILGIYKSFTDA
jgi:hypothetical protein